MHNPEMFSGKIVRLSGRIESDGLEYTIIKSSECPKDGAGISYSTTAASSRDVKLLERAILAAPSAGTRNKIIKATVSGVLKWDPSIPSIFKRTIVVERVTHLRIRIVNSSGN
jgi:hypothetical protein